MTNDDLETFAELWYATLEAYNQEPSSMAVELSFNALADFSIEQVKQGISAHMKDADEGKFPPKPAHIRRHLEGTGDARAHAAWEKLIHAIRRVGHHRSVCFDDRTIHAAIETLWGGWPEVCTQLTHDNESIYRAQFLAHYQQIDGRQDHGRNYLAGWFERQNRANSQPHDEPVHLVGDQSKATEVLASQPAETVAIGSAQIHDLTKQMPGSADA